MIHTMLPSQYETRRGLHLGDPHRRLMAAVLQAVIDDCREGASRRIAIHGPQGHSRGVRKAVAYVASRDRAWPFSFENLCEALGIDADRVRDELDIEREVIAA
jgi:hypothetical protein